MRGYFPQPAQCAAAICGAATSFSHDQAMMPPVSLPLTFCASTPVADTAKATPIIDNATATRIAASADLAPEA
jgi:hypothetical protein